MITHIIKMELHRVSATFYVSEGNQSEV